MSDMTFKTLWVLGNSDVKEFFNRIIGKVVGFDIKDYNLAYNELGKLNYKSLANKVDILLISPDKRIKINIELNRFDKNELINKNYSYILKLGGETYAGLTNKEKYKFNISFIQVNINGFKSRFDTEFTINEYSINYRITGTERTSLKIYDISLPEDNNSCYDIDEEMKKDLMMFTAKSYEELAEIAKSNKEREAVMKELERLGSDTKFVDYYDHDEFEEILKEAIARDAREEGIQTGEENHQKEIVLKLYHEKGKKIEEIANLIDISESKIKEIIG